MPDIPAAYLEIVDPLVNHARTLVEQGESLEALAFVGNLSTRQMATVAMNAESIQTKDAAARRIRDTACELQADFVFVVMEAWSLPSKKIKQMDQIIEPLRLNWRIAAPHRSRLVLARNPLRKLGGPGASQAEIWIEEKRTFGKPQFRLFTDTEGRLALLPDKGEADIPSLQ